MNRVLLLFPKDGQTGKHIRRGYEANGWEVIHLCSKAQHRLIPEWLKKGRIKAVVVARNGWLAEYAERVRSMGLPLISWNTDVRERLGVFFKQYGKDLDTLWSHCTHIYTMAKGQVHEYESRYPRAAVSWLSQGIDPGTHRREFITDADMRKYSCDVVFAGTYRNPLHKDRIKLIETIGRKFKLKLWGYKQTLYDHELNKAYQCAKVCLGNSAFPGTELSMSVRDYRVMGAGGFLLTNNVKGIDKWFDGMCATYTGVGDCLEKIDYYVKKGACEATEISIDGHDETHRLHRYADRVRRIIGDIGYGE